MNAIDSLLFVRSELFLTGSFFVILILDFLIEDKKWLGWLSILSLIVAYMIPPHFFPDEELFFGYLVWDPFAFFFKTATYVIMGLTLLASLAYDRIPRKQQ